MPDGQPLEFSGVSKRFGTVTAVSDLSARVEPGRVTGFLGPNGAGKTTTLRILLGLVRPSEGTATIGGVRYAELARPLQTVGAVLESSSFHPGRTAAAHLTVYAQAAGLPRRRVDETLGLVGLADAAGRKIGGFSLGMRQRLGLAYALLGDPGVLVLDEPTNGLDPEGIRWIRGFLRDLAREGRTVLVSSHLLAEVQQTVDALLIITQGRLVFQGTLDELTDPTEYATVVDSPDRAALVGALQTARVPFEVLRSGLTVRGADAVTVGRVAADAGVALSSLQRRGPALEEVFLELVDGIRVHPSALGANGAATAGAAVAEAAVAEAAVAGVEAAGAEDVDAGTAEAGAARVDDVDTEAAGAEAAPADDVDTEAAGAGDADTGAAPAEDGAPGDAIDSAAEDASDDAAGDSPAVATGDDAASVSSSDDEEAAGPPIDVDQPGEPGPDSDQPADDVLAGSTGADETSAPETPADPPSFSSTRTASFAVASTGVIDVVPAAGFEAGAPSAASDLPEDADPDVEALGEIDEELSSPEEDDRPWESKVKTEADQEADRFFAAFDTDQPDGDQPGSGAADPGDEEPEPDGADSDADAPQSERTDDDHEHDHREGDEPR
jgi:ABC-type multidrug transport system ATPase subunit